MKAFVCLLLVPLALAVWTLGSPATAWQVFQVLRRRRATPEPQGAGYTVIRVGATLAVVAIIVLLILISRSSD